MTHKEFTIMYDEYLRHGWVTSKIASVAAKQKEREREYNRNYYRNHSDKWNRSHRMYEENSETFPGTRYGRITYSGYVPEEVQNKAFKFKEIYRSPGLSKSEIDSIAEASEREKARKIRRNAEEIGKREKGKERVLSILDAAGVSVERAMRKMSNKVKWVVDDILNSDILYSVLNKN
jgi:hypothetical protein